MARNQFSYQKRQKELAKKKKREEKLARRQESKQDNADIPIEDQLPTVNQFGEVIAGRDRCSRRSAGPVAARSINRSAAGSDLSPA